MSARDRSVDAETVQAAVQGNVLRAYGNAFVHVRHLVLEIGDAAQASPPRSAICSIPPDPDPT